MKILAIETATEACSAALLIDGEIRQQYELAPREHAKKILVMIDKLMIEADLNPGQLDAIAFGRGPGSFIGVRIAAGVTQGIAYSADLPVAPVSTLAALAQGCAHEQVLAAIDARMNEIYFAQFKRFMDSNTVSLVGQEQLITPENVTIYDSDKALQWYAVGSGWQIYKEQLAHNLPLGINLQVNPSAEHLYPSAKSVAELAIPVVNAGETVSAEQAIPVYLRDQVANKPAK